MPIRRTVVRALFATVLGLAPSAAWAVEVLVEDWTRSSLGATGVPSGWTAYATLGGRPRYDFTVVEEDGRRALHLKSHDDHSTIAREVAVDLNVTPILEWSWKVVKFPEGADIRHRETSDLTAHLFAVWPRPPAWLRSRLIGHGWDERLPAHTIERSRKSSAVTFVIVRSGAADLDRWLTERCDVREEYQRVFGEAPDNPRAVAISIDTNDTHSTAEAYIGRIAFTSSASPSQPK